MHEELAASHVRLLPHAGEPAQHGLPSSPQATQLPVLSQIAPLLQLEPPQQGVPAVPQARQLPPEQVRGAAVVELHVLPLQQAIPAEPHAAHTPLPLHTLLAAVHGVLPAQHGWPMMPPQAAHCPEPAQIAPALHCVPQHGCLSLPHVTQVDWAVLQMLVASQDGVPLQQASVFAPHAVHFPDELHKNPVAQALLGQQGWPLPPQFPQVPFMHEMPVPLQVLAAQQGWPTPPHSAHVVEAVTQIVPACVQELPQHGSLSAPHALQVPPEQVVPEALQTLPAQQTWPDPPQATQLLPEHTDPPEQMFPQQGWVACPQAVHLPELSQVAPELQVVPQQLWPTAPQGVHWLAAEQTKLGAQFEPGQQA